MRLPPGPALFISPSSGTLSVATCYTGPSQRRRQDSRQLKDAQVVSVASGARGKCRHAVQLSADPHHHAGLRQTAWQACRTASTYANVGGKIRDANRCCSTPRPQDPVTASSPTNGAGLPRTGRRLRPALMHDHWRAHQGAGFIALRRPGHADEFQRDMYRVVRRRLIRPAGGPAA